MGEDMGEGAPGGLLRLEAVADPSDGQDVLGIGGIGLDLLAEALDVGVEGAAVTSLAVAPDAVHALLSGHDVACLGDQQGEKVELLAGELDRSLADRGLPEREGDADRTEWVGGNPNGGGLRAGRATHPTEHRPDTRRQLPRPRRL